MNRSSWFAVPCCLVIAGLICWRAQQRWYSPDPPNQTDRIFFKGWPRPFERTGGFAGFHDHYPGALILDIATFIIPGLFLGAAATVAMNRTPASPQ